MAFTLSLAEDCQPPDAARCFLSLWPPLLSDCGSSPLTHLEEYREARGLDLPSSLLARSARLVPVEHALDLRTCRNWRHAVVFDGNAFESRPKSR